MATSLVLSLRRVSVARVLVDDFCRGMWILRLKYKSEARTQLQLWKSMVETKWSKILGKPVTVRTIKTDNAGEFISKATRDYLFDERISIMSCLYHAARPKMVLLSALFCVFQLWSATLSFHAAWSIFSGSMRSTLPPIYHGSCQLVPTQVRSLPGSMSPA